MALSFFFSTATTVILLLATLCCKALYAHNGDIKFLAIGLWLAIEAGFAHCLNAKAKRWCASSGVPEMPGHDGLDLMRKVLGQLQFTPDYLTAWFLDAKLHDIHLGNLREFMAYGFWYKTYDQLSTADKTIIQAAIQQMEQQTGIYLPEGYNPNIHFMSHLWDALRSSYRPLLFYIGTESIAVFLHIILIVCGFKRHSFHGSEFYTLNLDRLNRNAASSSSTESSSLANQPLLFVHGVGLGLFPYLWLVYKLSRAGRILVMPHYSHVAMRWTAAIPTIHQCADSAAAFLAHLGIKQAHIMGHSYGTLVCARFTNCYVPMVSSLVLLDPVCFCMYMPTLVYTFLYAQRLCSLNFGGVMGWLLDQAWSGVQISRELHCASTFCRSFLWSEYNLWPDCLPARTLVALSDGDDLVAPVVKQQLQTMSNSRVLHHPTMPHGALLLKPSYIDLIIHSWEQMLYEPAAAKPARKATGTLANVVAAAEASATAAAHVSALQQAAVADSSWYAAAAAAKGTVHTAEDDSSSFSSDDAFMLLDQLSATKPRREVCDVAVPSFQLQARSR